MTENTVMDAASSGTDGNDDDSSFLLGILQYIWAWITGLTASLLIIIALIVQLVLTILQTVFKMLISLFGKVIKDPILLIISTIAVIVIGCILFIVAMVSLPIVIPLLFLALLFSPLLMMIGIPIIIAVLAVGVVVFPVVTGIVAIFAALSVLIFGVAGLPDAWFRLLKSSLNALSENSPSGDPVGDFISNLIFTVWKYLVPSLPTIGPDLNGISALLFREPCKYYEPREESSNYDEEVWIYINGIATTKDIADTNRDLLFEMFGRPIHLIHNPTDSVLFDLVECLAWKVGLFDLLQSIASIGGRLYKDPEDILFQNLKKFLCKENVKKVVLLAHSQGTIVTGNTLMRLLDGGDTEIKKYMKDKLEVYNFANCAHTMPDMTNIKYVENISNGGDCVAWLGHLFHETFPYNLLRFLWKDANGDYLEIGGKSVIERNLWGHLLNTHYLLPMQKSNKYTNDREDQECLDNNKSELVGYMKGHKDGVPASLQGPSTMKRPNILKMSSLSPSKID